uniref:Uncharacterized protein n=1 Tax=Oryza brachyantha TaxID=4533 RepID=J3MVV7_ORYBR
MELGVNRCIAIYTMMCCSWLTIHAHLRGFRGWQSALWRPHWCLPTSSRRRRGRGLCLSPMPLLHLFAISCMAGLCCSGEEEKTAWGTLQGESLTVIATSTEGHYLPWCHRQGPQHLVLLC